MRSVLPILLAVVLAATGVPHWLCTCGCWWIGPSKGEGAAGTPTGSCPHCCPQPRPDSRAGAAPADPAPCRCGPCDERLAVAQRAAAGALSGSDTWQRVVGVSWSLAVAEPAASSASRAGAAAFSRFALPVRALPVLLGRLLL